jgi:uncharacterized protein (DUF2235 family)
MPRNLVVCCDGTDNQFGSTKTNVVRLAEVLLRDPAKQLVYYDPGVGTLPEPGLLSKPAKAFSRILGLAFGLGLTRNVAEAYTFLMESWRPGDRVFLFGFSRGAYTVRVLAGLLHQLGLLPRGQGNLLPYAIRLFKAIRRNRPRRQGQVNVDDDEGPTYWRLCGQFRSTFAQPIPGSDTRYFPIHFLGAWDTVASVGWVWDPKFFPFTRTNPSVARVRHAVSLDERRWFYRQNLFAVADGQDLAELWFPGVHSDVGGGYPESEGGLWRVAFEWMLGEGRAAGLHIDDSRLTEVRTQTQPPERPWTQPAHNSLKSYWWLAEVFPKLVYRERLRRRVPALGLGRPRRVGRAATLHESVLYRVRETNYRPRNLSAAVVERILRLPSVPATLQLPAGGDSPNG